MQFWFTQVKIRAVLDHVFKYWLLGGEGVELIQYQNFKKFEIYILDWRLTNFIRKDIWLIGNWIKKTSETSNFAYKKFCTE